MLSNKIIKSSMLFALVVSLFHTTGCSSQIEESRLQQTNQNHNDSLSYTESIRNLAGKAQSVVETGLNDFSSETLPHQAKDLRKQIVRLRDILDVFSHNFAHELQLWDDVRDGLDDGYTVVGDYKDLFDTNRDAVNAIEKGEQPKYKNQKKLDERRLNVLNWKSTYFAENGLSEKIKTLFLNIQDLDSSNIVNSKKYSDFFWGGLKNIPSPRATPSQNARTLVNAQAEIAREEHSSVLAIKDPSTEKNELIFHDHRKRLRTIAKVCHVANSLKTETCNSAALKDIEALVVELGEIEDLIITGRHLEEDDKKKSAENAYEDAHKKFKKLKNKFEGKNMIEPLERL